MFVVTVFVFKIFKKKQYYIFFKNTQKKHSECETTKKMVRDDKKKVFVISYSQHVCVSSSRIHVKCEIAKTSVSPQYLFDNINKTQTFFVFF